MNTVVTQALACGLAVVTTRHSGLPEQVLDGVNGFVVEEGDWQALGERLVYLAEHPELLPAMSKAGPRHVSEQLQRCDADRAQIEAYEELAGRSARSVRHSD